MMTTPEAIKKRRDARAKPHLEQYAPVWLAEEKLATEDDAIMFNVIFQHNLYGWVSRRYRYDSFNDVLYHKGQIAISEDEALDMQQQEPYVSAMVTDIPNAYGG
jgi:hypothetical protein